MNDIYNRKVLAYFKKPKYYGKIQRPDGLGKVGNLVCGDVMWLYIKVGQRKDKRGKNEEYIKEAKFETFGCVAAIASSNAVCQIVRGKSIADALKLTKGEVINDLGNLPPVKIHCSVLAIDALREAVYNYLKKNKKIIPPELKKQHQLIEKNQKLLQKRYKELI